MLDFETESSSLSSSKNFFGELGKVKKVVIKPEVLQHPRGGEMRNGWFEFDSSVHVEVEDVSVCFSQFHNFIVVSVL